MGPKRLTAALVCLLVSVALIVVGVVMVAGLGVGLIVLGVLIGASVLFLFDVGSGDS